MTEYPVDTLIVEAVQSMFFQRIINFQPQPLRTTFDPGTIDQHIQNRKQHDTGEIRDHQSYRNGKSLIVEDSTRDTTHKYQRYKYSNRRKRRTQHRSHHLTCSRHAGSPQRIPFSLYCDIFSVTIIELSIIIPSARISPDREMILRDILHR